MVRCFSTAFAPTASGTLAAVTTTASTNPMVSTAMCRLRPVTFLAPSYPRAPPTSVALTDWLSTTAMRGAASRPAASRTCSRRAVSSFSQVPSQVHPWQ